MEGHNLNNVAVLEYYGAVDPPEGPNWQTMLCPFHEERRPSARSNGSGFICMGCGMRGDAVGLIMEREGIGFQDSVAKYEEITGTEYPALSRSSQQRRRPFSDSVSQSPRNYERNSSLLSLRFSKRSATRKRPRFSDR